MHPKAACNDAGRCECANTPVSFDEQIGIKRDATCIPERIANITIGVCGCTMTELTEDCKGELLKVAAACAAIGAEPSGLKPSAAADAGPGVNLRSRGAIAAIRECVAYRTLIAMRALYFYTI